MGDNPVNHQTVDKLAVLIDISDLNSEIACSGESWKHHEVE
jgi:hypothetical protein